MYNNARLFNKWMKAAARMGCVEAQNYLEEWKEYRLASDDEKLQILLQREEEVQKYCSCCKNDSLGNALLCTKCETTAYCSLECMELHYEEHKSECESKYAGRQRYCFGPGCDETDTEYVFKICKRCQHARYCSIIFKSCTSVPDTKRSVSF